MFGWQVDKLRVGILLVGLAGAGLLAGTLTMTLGGFSATVVNNTNLAASGTILLQEGQGATTCLSTSSTTITTNSANCTSVSLFGLSNAEPGGTPSTSTVNFKNVGTLNATTFAMQTAGCTAAANTATSPYSGSDTSGFCGKVDVTVENATTGNCVYPAGSGSCPAVSGSDTLAGLASLGTVGLGGLNSGSAESFLITTQLDSSATNADQGLSASEDVTWTLSQ